VTLLFSGLMMAFLEGMVLSRLTGLSTAVARIDSSQATFPQLPAAGNDELAKLAHNINSLLAAIEHSHQELHASEERFRLIAQATNEAIYDWRIAEDRLWWGESFSKLFGHNIPSGHTDLQTWAAFLHPDDARPIQDDLQNALKQTANFWSAEYRFRRADGTYADVLERGYFLRDDAGNAVRMLGAILDISERKQAALALQRAKHNLELQVQARTVELEQLNQQLQVELRERRQAQIVAQSARAEAEQANHAKSEFLARMSHELRTPLNAILGFGQLLEISDLKPRQQQSVQQILQGGRHLLALINEILDISRIESGNLALDLEAVIPDSVLTEAVELVMPLTAGNQIALEYSPSSCCQIPVLADKQRLKQVLINLLSNAIKYNRPNGKVKVTCHITAEQRFQCQITDTGHGIAPDDLPRLFQPFERLNVARPNIEARSNVEGTGLGLAFSQRFVEAMSGTISAESTLGVGSTFTIELALAEPTLATPSLLVPTTNHPSVNAPQHH
jgi:PAS domain S-box-containing protein